MTHEQEQAALAEVLQHLRQLCTTQDVLIIKIIDELETIITYLVTGK